MSKRTRDESAQKWQKGPLEEVYAEVFLDTIHYHIRSEGRIVNHAVYIVIGIDMHSRKDVLDMYVGENAACAPCQFVLL